MIAFILRRVFGMVLVLLAVSFIVFLIFVIIPGGDPAQRIAGRTATQQNIVNIRQKLGLDRPFYVQYAKLMQQTFQGNLISYTNQTNVRQEILRGLPATFSLAVGAGIVWLFFGVLVGVISAVTAGRLSDRLITVFALIGISMPVFWLGIILRYFLAEKVRIFPDGEYVPLTQDPFQWFWHLVLPWFTLAVLFIGFYGRVLRGNILDAINEDYVRTARAKGLAPRIVERRHVLRNAMLPVATVIGLQVGLLLSGAILTETVFAYPGIGTWLQQAIVNRDYPVIQGGILFVAVVVVAVNLVVDLSYGLLDPRIRLAGR